MYASYNSMRSYPPFAALVDAVKSGRVTLPRIFCHPIAAKEFIHKYLKRIDFPFVLITSHYDSDMPVGALTHYETALLLSCPHLVRWYTQNCVVTHPKITGLAIGLDYHTLANATTDHLWGKRQSPHEQDTSILQLRSRMKPNHTRILKCYSTCHMFIGRGHGQDRIDAMNQVPLSLLYLEKERVPRETSWRNQMEFSFVLSPHGNGLDCHRTWEALVLGCIPVVKTSPIDKLFTGLPVLIVKSWSDVTEELLKTTVDKFKELCNPKAESSAGIGDLPERLTLSYWNNKIRDGLDI